MDLSEKGFDIGTTNSPVTPVYMKGDLAGSNQYGNGYERKL